MSDLYIEPARSMRPLPAWLRSVCIGFLYWLMFLLALEPGNVLHARSLGHTLDIDRQALRISGAALLGSSVTPILLALLRRFPLVSAAGWRNALIHAAGAAGLSFGLILVSCFLAAWVLMAQALPSVADVSSQLAANWLLLIFVIGGFIAIAHAARFLPQPAHKGMSGLSRIPVKTRGRLHYVDIAGVEWIETQGNYLALHTGSSVHLIRESLLNFEGRLDPGKFVRIHRRVIVAADRIREMRPLTNGDSLLTLLDGQELRVSRRYRAEVRKLSDSAMISTPIRRRLAASTARPDSHACRVSRRCDAGSRMPS